MKGTNSSRLSTYISLLILVASVVGLFATIKVVGEKSPDQVYNSIPLENNSDRWVEGTNDNDNFAKYELEIKPTNLDTVNARGNEIDAEEARAEFTPTRISSPTMLLIANNQSTSTPSPNITATPTAANQIKNTPVITGSQITTSPTPTERSSRTLQSTPSVSASPKVEGCFELSSAEAGNVYYTDWQRLITTFKDIDLSDDGLQISVEGGFVKEEWSYSFPEDTDAEISLLQNGEKIRLFVPQQDREYFLDGKNDISFKSDEDFTVEICRTAPMGNISPTEGLQLTSIPSATIVPTVVVNKDEEINDVVAGVITTTPTLSENKFVSKVEVVQPIADLQNAVFEPLPSDFFDFVSSVGLLGLIALLLSLGFLIKTIKVLPFRGAKDVTLIVNAKDGAAIKYALITVFDKAKQNLVYSKYSSSKGAIPVKLKQGNYSIYLQKNCFQTIGMDISLNQTELVKERLVMREGDMMNLGLLFKPFQFGVWEGLAAFSYFVAALNMFVLLSLPSFIIFALISASAFTAILGSGGKLNLSKGIPPKSTGSPPIAQTNEPSTQQVPTSNVNPVSMNSPISQVTPAQIASNQAIPQNSPDFASNPSSEPKGFVFNSGGVRIPTL